MTFPRLALFALLTSFNADHASVSGCELSPNASTSQATGTGATACYITVAPGLVKVGDNLAEVPGQSVLCHSSSAQLFASGNACWFSLAAVIVDGTARVLVVPGTVAAVDSAAQPTYAQINSALGRDDFAVIGSVRFERTADTTVGTAVSYIHRHQYADSDTQTEIIADDSDTSTLTLAGKVRSIDFSVNLLSLSGLNAGDMYIDSAKVHVGNWGGAVVGWEYIPGVAGTGSGADLNLRITSGSTAAGDSTRLNLTLARSAIGQHYSVNGIEIPISKAAATLSVELDVKTTAFTAGAGTLRIFIDDYAV